MSIEGKIHDCAEKYIAAGYSVIPLGLSKKPLVNWKDYHSGSQRIKEWHFTKCNIAMLTGEPNKYVVIDCDTTEGYVGWLKHRQSTPLRVRSRKGMHFYYRHPGEYVKSDSHIEAAEGFTYDVKGDKAYCVAPPSIISGHQYQICVCSGNIEGKWLPPSRLPVFDPEWRPERSRAYLWKKSDEVKFPLKIIAGIYGTEGNRDTATFRVTMVCKEGGMSEAETIQAAIDWHQTNCTPPWDAHSIVEKVRRVYAE